jgi:hypothetical protein
MSAITSFASNALYKLTKFIKKRLRGIKMFFNFSVSPSEEDKNYTVPPSWRKQTQQELQQEEQPQVKVFHATQEPASVSQRAASNISGTTLPIAKSKISTTIDSRKFVMPKWHFPGLLKIKRLIAALMLIVDIAFSQFILGSTTGAAQAFMLLFIGNGFILADYIWKTRKPDKDIVQVERMKHSELK